MNPPSSMRPHLKRPSSAMMRSPRSNSRLSMVSKTADTTAASQSSDDDSRTAVKVAIRVRPPLQPQDPGYDLVPHRFRNSTSEVTSPTNLLVHQPTHGKKLFVFDRVFGEDVGQEGVWDYISDSIDAFVQGYNVSILAYGQSGSGKSYTMGTSGEDTGPAQMGVVPRAAAALLEKLRGPPSGIQSPSRYSSIGLPTMKSMPKLGQDKTWQLKATYVEIYNEQLRDLLVLESVPQHERAQVSIREDTKGRILLTGLHQVDITSIEDLLEALKFGSSIRQTDATAINARSSRSHAVFSLNLIQKKSQATTTTRLDKRRSVPVGSLSSIDSTVTTDSKLHFVDLAGSERLKNTGAQGDRAKEGISINAGLASLGKVISQLSTRSQNAHISYRDSRLTRLLQDSLGGNSITYMIACINPVEFHFNETLNTLTYAQRARAIQSKPQIQQSISDSDKNAMIERLKAEVTALRGIVGRESPTRTQHSPNKSSSKANELQDQLLNMQENYNALSQRHERMIMELRIASHDLNDDDGSQFFSENAVDRLHRSNSLSDAVENVVLEYEKTIQSLELSLANTRSALSTRETELDERESHIAFLEVAAAQSQKKLIKLTDREAHTEQYLQGLEGQLEGLTSSEESTGALVAGLRKELTRAKDNQSSTDDYILALEGRLAEAEQNRDMTKRDLERLERLIDRQRSVEAQTRETPAPDSFAKPSIEKDPKVESTNGYDAFHGRPDKDGVSPPSPLGVDANDIEIDIDSPVSPLEDELDDPFVDAASPSMSSQRQPDNILRPAGLTDSSTVLQATPPTKSRGPEDKDNIAPDKEVTQLADKVETLSQELFDLREDHESTLCEFDELRRKYAIALQTLAKVQDFEGKSINGDSTQPARSDSFLGLGESLQSLPSASDCSSRSASGIGEGRPTTAGSADTTVAEESAADIKTIEASNAKLIEAHSEAMAEIEYLKEELQKAFRSQQASPSKSPLIRRKPSQDMMATMGAVDRGNRAFASLRNIALDNFEANHDLRQNFELQLNIIMTELLSRTERAQQVESELASQRKQLEEKMTIIAGLTRERAKVAEMQQQLERHEQSHQDLTNAEEELVKQKKLVGDLQQEIDRGYQRHASLETGLNDHRTLVTKLQQQLDQTHQDREAAQRELNSHRDQVGALQQQLRQSNQERQVAEEELSKHQELVADLEHQLEENYQQREVVEGQLSQQRELVADMQRQLENSRGLPSPPPMVPLPPLPGSVTALPTRNWSPPSPQQDDSQALRKQIEDTEARVRTVEKHLYAEKQLTATLEEALTDLETAQNRSYQEIEAWRRKVRELEDELISLRKSNNNNRASIQLFEEERVHRMRSEAARRELEERLRSLELMRSATDQKKKKGGFNCF